MKTLVIGGSGTVGSRVVSGLVAKGVAVRVLSRTGKKIDASVEIALAISAIRPLLGPRSRVSTRCFC